MAEVVLYHHVQGLTEGVLAFADELRQQGHTVHTPDLFDGRTFGTVGEGLAFADQAGFDALVERGVAAADKTGSDAVFAGFSFGVMVAQRLAQTRPGASGAVLVSAALPASEFGGSWPPGVRLQIHMMENDELGGEDLPAARELAATVEGAELFLYPGDRHLFADSSLPDYDQAAAELLMKRMLALLADVDTR